MKRSVRQKWKALAVAMLTTVAILVPAAPANAASTCEAFGTVPTTSKYWINNNLWGRDSGSGWQCVWDTYVSGSTLGWGTSWSWTGQSNSVKSYSSAVLGWHWGWQKQNTGLPVRIWDRRTIDTSWQYRVSGSGTMNVAYDMWLHTINNPTWENNPTDEIMIWTYRSGGAGPVGTRQATVNIAGTNWDLYRGNIGWNVYSFVRTSNTQSVTFNMRDFLDNLVNRGWVSSSKYLTSVQAGTEVFTGTGQLDTGSYRVDIY